MTVIVIPGLTQPARYLSIRPDHGIRDGNDISRLNLKKS